MWMIITAVTMLLACDNTVYFLAFSGGWEALTGISSSSEGFRFFGVTLHVLAFALFVLLTFCETKLHESFWTSVLTGLGIFALVVSSSGGGKPIPGRSYKEYHLESYSNWMQHKVNNAHDWETYYKKAIVQANVCNKFSKEYEFDTLDAIRTRKLTPFESSCCMPPEDCSFNYTSSTVWIKPENGSYTDADCNSWDNDPETLCYGCQTCKAAFLQDVTTHYYIAGMALLAPALKQISVLLCCSCLCGTLIGIAYSVEWLGEMFEWLREKFEWLREKFDGLRRKFGLASSNDDYTPV